jgi:hypothetical protein
VSVLLVGLGAVMFLAIVSDILVTLLHPSARGPLSYRVNRLTWLGVRRVSILLRSRWLLTYAGPSAFGMNFLVWVLGLWAAFALVYLPFIDEFSYDPATPFGTPGLIEALYVSGTAISTVGFGDVVPSSDGLRLAIILESASGFGAFTAAVTYALSVYPLVTGIRSSAVRLADLGVLDPGAAARVADEAGPTEMAALHTSLIENDENTKRFPILYYFESGDPSESTTTLLRSGVMMCIVLRWGVSHTAVPHARFYGPALETTLRRLMDHYETSFVGGRSRRREEHPFLEDGDLTGRLEVLRTAVAGAGVEVPEEGGELPEGFASFVSRAEAFLDRIAYEHRNRHDPLLGSPELSRPEGADRPTARLARAAPRGR